MWLSLQSAGHISVFVKPQSGIVWSVQHTSEFISKCELDHSTRRDILFRHTFAYVVNSMVEVIGLLGTEVLSFVTLADGWRFRLWVIYWFSFLINYEFGLYVLVVYHDFVTPPRRYASGRSLHLSPVLDGWLCHRRMWSGWSLSMTVSPSRLWLWSFGAHLTRSLVGICT